jgi:hypothetical protein
MDVFLTGGYAGARPAGRAPPDASTAIACAPSSRDERGDEVLRGVGAEPIRSDLAAHPAGVSPPARSGKL